MLAKPKCDGGENNRGHRYGKRHNARDREAEDQNDCIAVHPPAKLQFDRERLEPRVEQSLNFGSKLVSFERSLC